MPSIAQQQADLLTRAMEDGDANAAAQVLLVAEDRGHVYTLAQMGANWREDVRTGFWSDVETLLRLETASDETTNTQPDALVVWVVESHYVGDETYPSATVWRTKEAALAAIARDAAAAKADDEEMGWTHEPAFPDAPHEHEDGGLEWRDEDGSWRTLQPQVVGE